MPHPRLELVVANWHKLIESFQTSPRDFYASVEEAIKRREIPAAKTSRIDWKEGGVISPRREYLRVEAGHRVFDVCAAPFGNGFFFSWWLADKPATWLWLWIVVFLAALVVLGGLLVGLPRMLPFLPLDENLIQRVQPFLAVFAIPILGWLVAIGARMGLGAPERAMLAIPVVNWFYERFFAPKTYYRIDTTIMFQSAVDSAVQEVVEGLMTSKGLRALTAEEKKPVFRDFPTW